VEWTLGYALTEIHSDKALGIHSPEKADRLVSATNRSQSILARLNIFKPIEAILRAIARKIADIFVSLSKVFQR
jgi:hypothetical protein